MNDLLNGNNSKMILYADEAVLICHSKSNKALKSSTETALDNARKWIAANMLSLNLNKTHCMHYPKRNSNDHLFEFELEIDKQKLYPEKSIK